MAIHLVINRNRIHRSEIFISGDIDIESQRDQFNKLVGKDVTICTFSPIVIWCFEQSEDYDNITVCVDGIDRPLRELADVPTLSRFRASISSLWIQGCLLQHNSIDNQD